MKELLVVVDMQKDFIDGSLGTREAAGIVSAVVDKVRRAAAEGREIVFTRDTHGGDYENTREGRYLPVPHCRRDTPGWDIHPDLAPYATEIFDKPGFGSPALVDYIKAGGYSRVEFVGLCTDICVVTNALMVKGALPELDVAVDPACCAGVTPESHEAALLTMKMCQINV